MKIIKLSLISIVLLNLIGCNQYEFNSKEIENKIVIESINIDSKYKIESKNGDIKGIVMFEESGRPNIENSNVVIGAHSGTGKYALFNNINKLKKDDKIIIYYNNEKYLYIVNVVKEVKDTNLGILENNNKSILTLLTCKINDNSKRIVVISVLEEDGKN